MTSKELIDRFNLSEKINYDDLSKKINEYLATDEPNKVDTIIQLVETVTELDWQLYQYKELLMQKRYSELYSSIISAYALNSKLGKVPSELTQLDIKLRSEEDDTKIAKLIDSAFIPLILNLLLKFSLDLTLLKLLDVILVTRQVCFKYHKKVKLTLDADKFRRLKNKYYKEITYFGFTNNFTEEQLKAVYRKKVMVLHPDHGGDPREFIKMREYYQTLSKLF